MQIIQNEDQSGKSDIAWFVQRHANNLEQIRGHYESLLTPSRAWRSWAAGRMTNLRSISVALPNGMYEDGTVMAGILPPIIYRWLNAAHPYVGSPFSWPRLPLLWYSPLWRLWRNVPSILETEPGDATGLGYYGAGEHLVAPVPLIELPSLDGLPSGLLMQDDLAQSPAEALVGRATSHFPLAALPSRLSPARMLTAHGIVSIPALFSPELTFHPASPLYPETELAYQSISTLVRIAAHTGLPYILDEQGISPYTYGEPTQTLTPNVPLLRRLTPLSTALQRLPILSEVAPAIFAGSESLRSRDDIGMRHFDSPLLSMASFPLATAIHLEPRPASWPSLDMFLVSSAHSGLIQARGFDMGDLMSWDAALHEEQGEMVEAPTALSWATLRETAPAVQKVQSQGAEFPSNRMARSHNLPYVPKPEMILGTFAASLLRELANRHEGMLVSAREGDPAEEGSPPLTTIYPSVMRPLAVFRPEEPYLATEASDLLPTMAAHRGDDAIMSPTTQAKATAFAVSRYSERLPLTHKALYPTPQHMHSWESADNPYSTFTPMAGVASQVGDLEGGQAPYDEEISPPMYSLEQIPFPDGIGVGEPARTVADLESILTRAGGPQQRGQSGAPSPASHPQNATAGYGGWSLPAATSPPSLSQSTSSQPTVARAPVDRPTDGGQAEEPEQGAPLDEIAEEVYSILKRRLAIERERSWGIG